MNGADLIIDVDKEAVILRLLLSPWMALGKTRKEINDDAAEYNSFWSFRWDDIRNKLNLIVLRFSGDSLPKKVQRKGNKISATKTRKLLRRISETINFSLFSLKRQRRPKQIPFTN